MNTMSIEGQLQTQLKMYAETVEQMERVEKIIGNELSHLIKAVRPRGGGKAVQGDMLLNDQAQALLVRIEGGYTDVSNFSQLIQTTLSVFSGYSFEQSSTKQVVEDMKCRLKLLMSIYDVAKIRLGNWFPTITAAQEQAA